MELCLMIEGQEGVTWPQWVALARACEAHGIQKLFRSDHYLQLVGAERGSLDAWGTLCALAATTSTLRLGTLVSPATFRHPSELAKLVTTADRISGGRVSSASVPAGTNASTRHTDLRSRRCAPAWTYSRSSSRSCSATGADRRGRSHSRASTTGCTSSTPSPSRCSGPTRR